MAVELIVTELFNRGNTRFPKGTLIRDEATMAWVQKNRPRHAMRKFYDDTPPAVPAAAKRARGGAK